MIVIGLTGSIASGKSTVAAMFADAGVPVFSADEAVHRLYEGEAIGAIAAAFPAAIAEGKVDRAKLGEIVQSDPAALRRLETLVHPLVRKEALTFVTQQRQAGMPIARSPTTPAAIMGAAFRRPGDDHGEGCRVILKFALMLRA